MTEQGVEQAAAQFGFIANPHFADEGGGSSSSRAAR